MKKLDQEQKEAVIQLCKVLFAREMVGFVQLKNEDKCLPREKGCWHAESRTTILDLLYEKRDKLLKDLGLEDSPLKP